MYWEARRHIDIGGQASRAVQDGGLRVKEVPLDVSALEGGAQIGQQLSDDRTRSRDGRPAVGSCSTSIFVRTR